MSSRDEILASIRQQKSAATELPRLDHPWTCYEDPAAKFAEVLKSVGGQCVVAASCTAIRQHLEEQEPFRAATSVYSTLEQIESRPGCESVSDPHQLERIDYAVLRGEFGVAENAAVWVTDAAVRHRVIYFIVQHLVLVVPDDQIVNNLHEAYQKLRFQDAGFGVFISGPSKTADIEQSLVIGAHGPRSLIVYLLRQSQDENREATAQA